MAERDGTIVIDTQIDTKGVDAGSEKTEASLRRIFHLSMILTNSQLRIRLPKHHPVTADRVVAVSILAKCLRMSR